ncbi:hypothetical protein HanRHA438_Chr10g0452051 [Helianthus annuus]|nr:hypothetical protein HanRHA438_Chr10g0452051 [Helianthus annuus]
MDLLSGSAGVVMDRSYWISYNGYIGFEFIYETIAKRLIICFRYITLCESILCLTFNLGN